MVCVGKKAPDFSCQAAIKEEIVNVTLKDFDGKYKLIFFYPLDFTFVCPTELHAFQDRLSDFQDRNVQVLGASVDSVDSHLKWLQTPKNKGGIEGVSYPLLSDVSRAIIRDYGVLCDDENVAFRGMFLLDKDNVVQSMQINNLSIGRSIDEVLRLIDALQFVEEHGQVCPANWSKGDKAMTPNEQGLNEYFGDSSS
ncbi:peroxiredoxin [bacterium]|jgi:peroxiredoxin 2/4|nr:peroxiredoxin [bacterium]MBT3903240.1 peroxiredoxin [bacterium]MBT4578134.1 peroxiredoxin [bacterium]MBT5345564.1 peroxiredoxin [bacterium]MBT6131077.1 peroxiredoxin [bacterium]